LVSAASPDPRSRAYANLGARPEIAWAFHISNLIGSAGPLRANAFLPVAVLAKVLEKGGTGR
jgi:hypothetical protein